MTESPGSAETGDHVDEDETVRVREQTANDIGSTDAFGPEDDSDLDRED